MLVSEFKNGTCVPIFLPQNIDRVFNLATCSRCSHRLCRGAAKLDTGNGNPCVVVRVSENNVVRVAVGYRVVGGDQKADIVVVFDPPCAERELLDKVVGPGENLSGIEGMSVFVKPVAPAVFNANDGGCAAYAWAENFVELQQK